MKKIIITTVIILAIIIGFSASKVKAFQSFFQTFTSAGTTSSSTASSTVTTAFTIGQFATASTTYNLANNGGEYNTTVDQNYLFVQAVASTSLSVVNFKFQYATGLGGVNCYDTPKNCDWYDYITAIAPTTAGGISYASSTNSINLNDRNASTTRFTLQVPRIASPWKRVVFWATQGQASTTLFLMDTAYSLPTNQ